MAQFVSWDVKHNRPIVDNKVTNPTTGEIEEAGSDGYTTGPPSVDVIWINMDSRSNFRIIRSSFPGPMDKVFLQIADHVRRGLYLLVSVSASAYSFAVICKTEKTQGEINEAVHQMGVNLLEDIPISCPLVVKQVTIS
jgi:hypothetical protein